MKISNKQIPNIAVYLALYAVIFATSIWLLVFHSENPTNWILYIGVIVALLAGAVKFAFHIAKERRKPTTPA